MANYKTTSPYNTFAPKPTTRGLVPNDLVYFRWLDEMTVSPDGKQVAYTVRRVDDSRSGYVVDVFIQPLASGQPARRVTSGNSSASSLAWSTDSSKLAFVESEKGVTTVRVVYAGGGTGSDQSFVVQGPAPSALDWSPDGRMLACVRWTEVKRGNEPVYGDPWPIAPQMRVITRGVYKLNGVGFIENKYKHIWLLDLVTGHWQQITDGEWDHGQPRWSPSGTRLLFVRTERELNTAIGAGELVIWQLEDASAITPLDHWYGIAQSPIWAPDESALIFTANPGPVLQNWRTYSSVYRYDFATGEVVDLLPDVNEAVGNYAVADQRKGLSNITVRWANGTDLIYFLLTIQGAVHLYAMRPDGTQRHKVVGEKNVIFDFAPTANHVVYGQADTQNPGDLYILEQGQTRRLTNLNPWLKSRQLSTPEEYWYKGLEGADVHAWMMKPVRFEEGKRYPLILQVHCSMFSWDFNFENHVMTQAGFAVAYFNQRGTTAGYGEPWTEASLGQVPDVEYQEIMIGVDDMLARFPFVDEKRMGVTGGSCGGILTNWIVTHTDRFAAAVTQRSITNYVSRIGAGDTGPLHELSELKTHPWENLQYVWQRSAISHAANVTTPLLIVHSDEDHRCPIEQAEEFFTVLRWMGKTVEFCWFQGESHDLTRAGRPQNRVEHMRRIIGWFVKYLGTEPSPAQPA
jgi:dipeptidyl aminopeptidase/acylaminoacyl peptidase